MRMFVLGAHSKVTCHYGVTIVTYLRHHFAIFLYMLQSSNSTWMRQSVGFLCLFVEGLSPTFSDDIRRQLLLGAMSHLMKYDIIELTVWSGYAVISRIFVLVMYALNDYCDKRLPSKYIMRLPQHNRITHLIKDITFHGLFRQLWSC